MRKLLQVFTALLVLVNPLAALASDVSLEGPFYDQGTDIRIGKIEGKILRRDTKGIYVKVKKKDAKLESHGDLTTQRLLELYTDKDWDESNIMIFIPAPDLKKLTSDSPEETPVAPEPERKSTMQCYMEGKEHGRDISSGGSTAGGFVGGLFLGLLGTGLAVVLQDDPDVPVYLLPEDEDCQLPFMQGYREEGKSKKRNAALTGGLVGTAAFILLLVSATQ